MKIVIQEGHTLVSVLGFVHDYQGHTLVCCKDHVGGIFPEGSDGLPLLFGDVLSVSLLVFVVL